MSVDFNARVILGYHVLREEFNSVTKCFGDECAERIRDDYMIYSDSYDENSDLFFIIKDFCNTNNWEFLNVEYEKDEDYLERKNKFHKVFGRICEEPKLILIEEIW